MKIYDRLLEIYPAHTKAPLYRAVSLSLSAKDKPELTEQALLIFDQMLLASPHRNDVRCHRAGALKRLGRLDEAGAEYERVIRGATEDLSTEDLSNEKGWWEWTREGQEKRLIGGAQAGTAQGELGAAWFNYGAMRQSQRRMQEAEHCYRSVVEVPSGVPPRTRAEAMVNLGSIITSTVGPERTAADPEVEAAKLYGDALKLAPDSPAVLINRANSLQRMRRYLEAIELYMKVVNANPAHSLAWFNMGVGYESTDQLERADWAYLLRSMSQCHTVCHNVIQYV